MEEQNREQAKIEAILENEREHAKRIARSMRAFLNSPEGDDFLELIDRWSLAFQRRGLDDDETPRAAYRLAIEALQSLKRSMVEYKDFAFTADEEEDDEEDDSVVRDALNSFNVDGL